MPFYDKGDVRIHYQDAGSGFPLLVIPGGGLNSTIEGLATHPFNPFDEFKSEFRVISADLRNAKGGQSTGPLAVDRPWDAYTDDQIGLMDHLGINKFMVLGFCIGGPFIWNMLKRFGDRVVAAVPAQPSGYRPEMPGMSYNNNMKGWGPELCARRPDITMAMVDTFLTNMYGGARADFVYTVSRDFVRGFARPRSWSCPTTCRPTPMPWRWRPCTSRPTRRSAFTRGRTRRTKFRWRCGTFAPSCAPTSRSRDGHRWPPPRNNGAVSAWVGA